MNDPVIHWFRQDLRVSDNPALCAAVRSKRPLVAVYILDDETPGAWAMGGASRWWLHHSLERLAQALTQRGGRLILRRGRADRILPALVAETGAAALSWTRCYEPYARRLERTVHDALADRLEIRRFGGALLFEPERIVTGKGDPFRVFTPFWKACLREPEPAMPIPAPARIETGPRDLRSDALEDWELLPVNPDWAGGLRAGWTPGEPGASDRLAGFIDTALAAYSSARDLPAVPGTSRMSPHLHFGEISPRQVWHSVRAPAAWRDEPPAAGDAYLRQIGWREFSHHLLHHWPHLPEDPFRPDFTNFPWRHDDDGLRAWQQGRTGIPIVDAGMRELWHTGWMHNRVRMIAASLLVKNLLIPWQAGEAWFWDTLVDADLANNAAGWQWVAGCGADAAPYFRIFNPVLQGKKFDPNGAYVRRWVPEIAGLPDRHLHEPWAAPRDLFSAAGITRGSEYPAPIVDLKTSRQRALDAFAAIRAESGSGRGGG